MNPDSVSVGLALTAGVVSFLSPCVLSLVPGYLAYLSGRAITLDGAMVSNRRETTMHGVAFVLGFSAVFIALGATASALGAALLPARDAITKLGGIIVILFGLHTMGVLHIPFLDYDTRQHKAPNPRLGYLSSSLMGVFFSAGWSPCVGPVLGAVLTLALTTNSIGRGVMLLTAYSIGLGIPFVLTALGLGRATELIRRFKKHMRYFSLATGAFLVLIGILIFTNSLQVFATLAFVSDLQARLDDGAVAFWHWLTGGH